MVGSEGGSWPVATRCGGSAAFRVRERVCDLPGGWYWLGYRTAGSCTVGDRICEDRYRDQFEDEHDELHSVVVCSAEPFVEPCPCDTAAVLREALRPYVLLCVKYVRVLELRYCGGEWLRNVLICGQSDCVDYVVDITKKTPWAYFNITEKQLPGILE